MAAPQQHHLYLVPRTIKKDHAKNYTEGSWKELPRTVLKDHEISSTKQSISWIIHPIISIFCGNTKFAEKTSRCRRIFQWMSIPFQIWFPSSFLFFCRYPSWSLLVACLRTFVLTPGYGSLRSCRNREWVQKPSFHIYWDPQHRNSLARLWTTDSRTPAL